MTQNKLRVKGVNTGGGTPTPNYTFKTTAVSGTNYAYIETSTGYIKFNATVYNLNETGGDVNYTLDDPNGEYTLVACDEFGAPSGDITLLNLGNNQITHFNGTGLNSLTQLSLESNLLIEFVGGNMTGLNILYLNSNQLTSFNGTGLTNLYELYLDYNGLSSFNGTGLSSLTILNLSDNQLTSFNGTGLTSLTSLYLNNNQLTSFDTSPFTSLTNLQLPDNLLDSADIDSILAQLDDNGVENGEFIFSGNRTPASNTDYNNLIGKGWAIDYF